MMLCSLATTLSSIYLYLQPGISRFQAHANESQSIELCPSILIDYVAWSLPNAERSPKRKEAQC